MCLDWDSVVWFVTVVSGRRLDRIVNRLSAVNAHRMSRLVSLVALDPQPLPRRAPSGIAHGYLHNKSGPLKARGAMTYIALSACATTLLAGVDPAPPLGQHMPRHVLLPIFRHQQRYICNKRAPPRWRKRRPKRKKSYGLSCFVSVYIILA